MKLGEPNRLINISSVPSETVGSTEQLTKEVAKGGAISFFGAIFSRGAGMIFNILLGRVLGASSYGLYYLGFYVLTIAHQFSMLGLDSGTVRFVPLYKWEGDLKKVKGVLNSAFLISTACGVMVGILLFVFSDFISTRIFHKPDLTVVLKIFSIALPFYVLMTIFAASARGFKVIKYYVGIENIFQPTAKLVIVSIAFLIGFKMVGAVYGLLISVVIAAFFGFYLLRRLFPEIIYGLRASYELRILLRFCFPMLLIAFVGVLGSRVNVLILGYVGSSSEIGIYNAASIFTLLGLISNSFRTIFAPIISELHNRAKLIELGRLFKVVTKWSFTLALPMFLVLACFSKNIMGILGAEFVAGWSVLITLCFFDLVREGTGCVGTILVMSGKQNINLINNVCVLVVSIILNIWLIRIYGIIGAAIATGLSVMMIDFVKLIEIYILLGIHPYSKKYFKPLLAGLIGAIFGVLFIRFNLLWIVGLIALPIIYFTTLYFLGFDDEDMVILKAVRAKFRSFKQETSKKVQ